MTKVALAIEERLDILKRICVRGRNYLLEREDSVGLDFFEHLETELGWLRSAIEGDTV